MFLCVGARGGKLAVAPPPTDAAAACGFCPFPPDAADVTCGRAAPPFDGSGNYRFCCVPSGGGCRPSLGIAPSGIPFPLLTVLGAPPVVGAVAGGAGI